MTDLEKSVRKNLHSYLGSVRSGLWQPMGATGMMPGNFSVLGHACADAEDGLCTDITLYSPTDGRERRHYEQGSGVTDITDIIQAWLSGSTEDGADADYDSTVSDICDRIRSSLKEE